MIIGSRPTAALLRHAGRTANSAKIPAFGDAERQSALSKFQGERRGRRDTEHGGNVPMADQQKKGTEPRQRHDAKIEAGKIGRPEQQRPRRHGRHEGSRSARRDGHARDR